ncbi:BLUF domain-containing protein [Mucilaginibacter celer]|uniref:BLUF domain-containing protein n=1 Tax=Mucilaginibacter celer TaxID=2305508 RepID=A0A494VS30_9SPHI|nr:BLUF domain-containing protein [Mucilaginibacter celer]AYL98417.1 BLUF domain-containing protein [Mucilaginibacter celer]
MKYLIYLSTAVNLFSQDQLEELLKKARANNAKKSVTGMLLYYDGSFIQVLEGDATDVDAVYDTIKADNRHKDLIKIADGEHDERAFAAWSMGFRRGTATEFAELEAFTDPRKLSELVSGSDHPAFIMLKTFVRTNLQ